MSKEREEVKSLPIAVIGPRIVVCPLEVPKKTSSSIILPNRGIDRMDLDNGKKNEHKARDLFELTTEHPYQGIIVAIGKEGEEAGLKLGDIVYTSYALELSRDAIRVNDQVYIVMGITSAYCTVGNIALEEEVIKSFVL